MTGCPYPIGAEPIAAARAKGLRPAGPVLVIAHGRFHWDNAMVYVQAGQQYRWDWVKGLPGIVVLVGAATKLGQLLSDIEDGEPNQIDVIDHERELGWMVTQTRPKLRTARWHSAEVKDWLGDQTMHRTLQQSRIEHGLVAA